MNPPENPPPSSSSSAYGRWVEPPEDPRRGQRQWTAIERTLDERRPFWERWSQGRPARWGVAMAFAGAAMIGGLTFGVVRFASHSTTSPVASSSATEATSNVVLADGSRVVLDTGATFAVPKNEPLKIETVLEGGGATFDVVPNRERSFTVVAESVEVRVVGTGFKVDVDRNTHVVTVKVDHGIVEVRAPMLHGEVKRLLAGQAWSSGDAQPSTPEPVVSDSAVASASAAPSMAAPGLSAADDAKALFESANRARRAGDLARAASLYRELCARHPEDARAQVAALELARIEMDQGGSSSVAEDALRTASSANPGSSVHEDSLARLVSLYGKKGDKKACEKARADYLAAYPDGVHVAQVRNACGSSGSSPGVPPPR